MDSGATHHITNDLDRLHLSSPYSGSDQLIVGDGSTLPITHTDEDVEAQYTSTKVRTDLSQWQERHAILILSRVKEISQLRYVLCPRHLKENQFWRIYFLLARNHIVEYELRAIQQEKLKQMAMEDEKSSDNSPYEIEMAEAKHGNFIEPLPPS
ncbi:BSD domain [Sesbania bispinosa]|nr:BSD domain [Sesbania bispinosa]